MSTSAAPRAASASSDALNARATSGSTPCSSSRARHADPRAADIAGQRRRVIGHRLGRAGRVRRVGARDHAERDRRIVDGPRQRPDLIERGTERNQAVPRDAAVGWLESDHAAHRGRLPNRSAGVGPERQRRDARRDGGGRSAARAAGDAIERPRVVHGTERRVLVRRAHRELVAVGLADERSRPRRRACETTVAS